MKFFGKERYLNVFGKILVQLLICSFQDQLQSGEFLWFFEYVRGLGVLLFMLVVDELDIVFFYILQRDFVLVFVVGVDLFDYCLVWCIQVVFSIVVLFFQESCIYLLWFEQWCLQVGLGFGFQGDLDDFFFFIYVYFQCRIWSYFICLVGVFFVVIFVLRKILWRQLQSRFFSIDSFLVFGLYQEILVQLVLFV